MKFARSFAFSALLIAGAFLAGYALHRPVPLGIMATASSESSGAVLSTGYFNNGVEALYYLDSQSGRLSADFTRNASRGLSARRYSRYAK